MYTKYLLLLILLSGVFASGAQTQNLQGIVLDGQGKPMKFATISLLSPNDSTLMFFGISNASGVFEIKNTIKGEYLLQAAMLGYKTYYKNIEQPLGNNGDLGVIILDQIDVQQMTGVEIVGERIPLLIKNDTVEYDAGAFKTKADASTEELLKKLPGIEVDRAGNIKAQGEQVNRVFVDGKEFFGNDPKVATRNLPADAIKKVQVYDKKSDRTEFTGIDDGSRERSINLMLKDGKKQGYFGDVTAGGGTNERFKAAAKLYRFRSESQFAVMGMTNNINRSGFSFSDYLNFSGGLQNMLSGGGNMNLQISSGDNMPIDFGQPVTGLVTSGAAGINYSYEFARNKRISISYLGNAANKKLNEQSWSRNFTQQQEYITEGINKQQTDNIAHRLNINLRNDIDSFTQVSFFANGELSNNTYNNSGTSASNIADVLVNNQTGTTTETANAIGGKPGASLTHRSNTGKSVWGLTGNGSYKQNLEENEWQNITTFLRQSHQVSNNLFRDDKVTAYSYSGAGSWSYAVGKGYFIQPELTVGNNVGNLRRVQGIPQTGADIIDSLSPDFESNYLYLRPGISFKKGTPKIQYTAALNYEQGWLSQLQDGVVSPTRSMGYVLPSFSWRNEYATSKHIAFSYNTAVQAPAYNQLLSVPVLSGPLSTSSGNSALRPEYSHTARASWMLFDQFTFTSLFVQVRGTYKHDKISRTISVNNNLAQYNSLTNVPDNYDAGGGIQFSRPIGKLGIKLNAGFDEDFNKSITLVNGVDNVTTSFTHQFRLGVGNKKKEHWDAEVGASISLTDTKYSVQQPLNNLYYNTGAYLELSYRPNDHWYFMLATDVTRYNARSFQSAVIIPLVRSEVSYYFLKGNRGVLTLDGFDLLKGNKGLQRISQQNYIGEVRSDIIGQYFMLSFKYRLNKTGKKSAAMFDDIDINVH